MKRKPSVAWKFFDRTVSNRGNCVVCKLCHCELKFSGNTTNLRAHVIAKHPIQWDLLAEQGSSVILQSDDESSASKQIKLLVHDPSDFETERDTETEQAQEADDIGNASYNEEWLEADPIELRQYIKREPRAKRQRRETRRNRKSPHLDPIWKPHHTSSPINYPEPNQDRPVPNRHQIDVFGEYVAKRLHGLPPGPACANVQQLMGTLLWQAELGAYDDMEAVKRLLLNMVVDRPIITYPSQVACDKNDATNTVTVDVVADTEPETV